MRGLTNRYYAGGVGVYIGQDGFKYTDLVLRLFSPAPFSSILRIELYDDDNGNGSVDLEIGKNEPISDDIFVYNLIIDWEGWKEVRIPIDAFEDDNPTVGDNIMNPYKLNNSEGLLQAQLVFLSIKKSEQEIFLKLDYIGLEGSR